MESTSGFNNIPAIDKGVMFNKPRPSAFGFQNGYVGDGINDYFEFTGEMSNHYEQSFECWVKLPSTWTTNGAVLQLYTPDNSGSNFFLLGGGNAGIGLSTFGRNMSATGILTGTGKRHIVYTISYNKDEHTSRTVRIYVNGSLAYTNSTNIDSNPFTPFSRFLIGRTSSVTSSYIPMDEFRYYTYELTAQQVFSLYNYGHGHNPLSMIDLEFWYKFNQFDDIGGVKKMLDFSGNNRHLTPFNMVTDPSNPNYVLKPF